MGFNLTEFIKGAGYLGIGFVVFAESGLLIGFLLPGDSLLFTAGFLASQGYLDVAILIIVCLASAIVGDNVGYSFGYRIGPRIFKKEDSLIFSKKNLHKTEAYYSRYGGKTLILARFMPIVRTFAPILAGVAHMSYRTFFFFNVVGGALWVFSLLLLGYFLGSLIPNIDRYLLPIIIAIVGISVLPSVIHVLRDPEEREKIMYFLKLKK